MAFNVIIARRRHRRTAEDRRAARRREERNAFRARKRCQITFEGSKGTNGRLGMEESK